MNDSSDNRMEDYGFCYINQAHRRSCDEQDEYQAQQLPDSYLATFIKHFADGNFRNDLPNPLLCPHPHFLTIQARLRGWVHEESPSVVTIKFPENVQPLSPIPMVLPNKMRRKIP